MKKFNNWFFYLLAFWLALSIGYRGVGWFTNLYVIEKDMGPYTIAYASFTWRLINVHETLSMIRETLSGEHIKYSLPVAIFKYRYEKGKSYRIWMEAWYIIDAKDMEKLNKKSHIYDIKTIYEGKKIVVLFPYKSTFADILWHMRSTAKMNEYLQSKQYTETSITEVFDRANNVIAYMTEPQK